MNLKFPQIAVLLTLALCGPLAAQPLAPVAACTDFDAHVNAAWSAQTVLPPDRARIGSFDELRRANDRLLETALAELARDATPQQTPGLRLLAAYYRSGLDEAAIEAAGLTALQPLLARIDGLTRADLPALLGALSLHQIDLPLRLGVSTDAKNATRYTLTASQGGLGLPDRDDYLKDDDSTTRLRAGYRRYAQQLFAAAGLPDDAAALDALMAMETAIARASMSRVQRRDPNASYNPTDGAGLGALAPGFDWAGWLSAYAGVSSRPLVLGQPELARALARLAQVTPVTDWQAYLRLRLLDATAERLPKAFAKAHFDYRSGVVRGLQTAPPRVERVILAMGGGFGNAPLAQALGELYVSKSFSLLAQQRALQMVDDIREAMRQRIKASLWMSPPTQALALAKLDAIVAKIGAPSAWPRYEGLQIKPDDYAGNLLRSNLWDSRRRLADLDRSVDRERWNTSPHIVNAFAAGGNQIVFPAGILQPPFFDETADDASNYGAIGMIIGHEITHHFDDRGRQFDAVGNLRDWWTPADATAYKVRAERVAALYSSYQPFPGAYINGQQTLGENISDFGGMQIAYAGLQIALARQRASGQPGALRDGLTASQAFFHANALIWRNKQRSEALMDQLRTGVHSPGRYRILGPMSHLPAFAQAFGCQAGDAMVAANPIMIW